MSPPPLSLSAYLSQAPGLTTQGICFQSAFILGFGDAIEEDGNCNGIVQPPMYVSCLCQEDSPQVQYWITNYFSGRAGQCDSGISTALLSTYSSFCQKATKDAAVASTSNTAATTTSNASAGQSSSSASAGQSGNVTPQTSSSLSTSAISTTPASGSPTSSSDSSNTTGLTTDKIVGIVIGVLGLLVAIFGAWVAWRWRNKHAHTRNSHPERLAMGDVCQTGNGYQQHAGRDINYINNGPGHRPWDRA